MSCTKIQLSNEGINRFCGAPDVANAAVVLTSSISAEGGSVGRQVLASRHNLDSVESTETSKLSVVRGAPDQKLQAKQQEILQFTDEHDLSWSMKLRKDSLYVEVPQQLSEGSKEKFVNLLEFADDVLKCHNVIVCFDKARPDRASLVKTFMFLGFHLLSPENTLIPSTNKNPDQLFLIYMIDSDD